MIGTHVLKSRNQYLEKLIAFQDTEPVKVVTGIRRCGKSRCFHCRFRNLYIFMISR